MSTKTQSPPSSSNPIRTGGDLKLPKFKAKSSQPPAEVFEKARLGDPAATEQLFYHYERLLHHTTWQAVEQYHLDHSELYGVALVAFMQSLRGYDPSAGVRFTSYLVASLRNNFNRYAKYRGASTRKPTGTCEVSLEEPVFENRRGEVVTLLETIQDDSPASDPTSDLDLDFLKSVVSRVVHSLTPSCRKIIALYLSGMGVSEAARRLGCSRNYVSAVIRSFRSRVASELRRLGYFA